jgi:hypothetical protein
MCIDYQRNVNLTNDADVIAIRAAKEYLELREEIAALEESLNGHDCPAEFETCTLCETYGDKQTQYRGMQRNWATKWASMLARVESEESK